VIAPVEVRPNPARVLPMLFGVCALVLGAGAVVGDPAVAMPLRVLAPLGAAIGAAVIIVLWTRARKARITVDATVLERIGVITRERLEWSQITRYRYLSVKQPAVAHGRGGSGMVGLVTGALAERSAQRRQGANHYFGLGTLELFTADASMRIGKHPFFGPSSGYTELSELMGLLLDELHERLGRDASFAPFTLDTLSLRDRTGRAVRPGPGLRVTLGDGKLQIADWRPIKMDTVDNVMLLVQLLAARGSIVQIAPEVYVPPAMTSGGAWTSSINTPSPERGATSLPLG
jgi:hypothetical protein